MSTISKEPDPASPDHIQRQFAFAAHIRDPDHAPRPSDVEDRRMKIYRELFYNNVEGFLANGFPVLKSLLAEERWHAMVRDFMVTHRCETPLFAGIPQEFLDYLHTERPCRPADPPFLLELAHYEWVELDVAIGEETADDSGLDPNGDLLAGVPVVSSLVWNLAYEYPVHQISPEFQPDDTDQESTFLAVYRDRQDKVHFLELNALTHRLLNLLKEKGDRTGLNVLEAVAEEMQTANPAVVIDAGASLLKGMKDRNILLGTRNTRAAVTTAAQRKEIINADAAEQIPGPPGHHPSH